MTIPCVFYCIKRVFCYPMDFWFVWVLIANIFPHSEGLGEGYDGDIAFASALESFGGGHNDPISLAFGGMSICLCWKLVYLLWLLKWFLTWLFC